MVNTPKTLALDADLHAYVVAHGTPPDDIQRGLIEETRSLGGISIMQIASEQGAFMTVLARLMGARRAIEIGTFTGYSALCLARGLPEDGQLICCDVSEEWTSVGRPYWDRAGVAGRIELRIGPALETLEKIPADRSFDLAFIDADKPNYAAYYDLLLERIRPGGAILVDNVLWSGAVIDPEAKDENTLAIRAFNDKVAADERVDAAMISVGDGLTILRLRE